MIVRSYGIFRAYFLLLQWAEEQKNCFPVPVNLPTALSNFSNGLLVVPVAINAGYCLNVFKWADSSERQVRFEFSRVAVKCLYNAKNNVDYNSGALGTQCDCHPWSLLPPIAIPCRLPITVNWVTWFWRNFYEPPHGICRELTTTGRAEANIPCASCEAFPRGVWTSFYG